MKKLRENVALFNDTKPYIGPTTTPTTTLLSVKGDIARFEATGTNLTFATESAYKLGKTVKHLASLTTPLPLLKSPPIDFQDERPPGEAQQQGFHDHQFADVEDVAPLPKRMRLPTTPAPED